MPAGILRRGRIARASPMEKVRSMRAFFITERAVNYRFRSNWNYVGRHGADKFSTRYPRGLSGGQFTDSEPLLPVRDDCPRSDGLDCKNNNLCERGTVPVLPG